MSKKGVIFFKILISEFSEFFLKFILIFQEFLILFKKRAKGCYFSARIAELTWCTATRGKATRGHARPRGCLRDARVAPTWRKGVGMVVMLCSFKTNRKFTQKNCTEPCSLFCSFCVQKLKQLFAHFAHNSHNPNKICTV